MDRTTIVTTMTLAALIATAACSGSASPAPDPAPASTSASPVDAPAHPLATPPKVVHRLANAIAAKGSRTTAGIPIAYNGGYVMGGTVNVYLIWYGDWTGWRAPTVLPEFVTSLGESTYFATNATYDDAHGRTVSGKLQLAGQTSDAYSHGTSLGDGDVGDIVAGAIDAGAFPADVHGVYVVLTSDDVTEGGFCGGYCGYHSYQLVKDVNVKYAFVGNPAQCPYGCEPQQGTSPNDSPSADGMASILAHELDETVTDPYSDGWYDADGEENGDKCAWTFGDEYTAANGTRANVRLGARDYLIQQNWVNTGSGYCALSP